MTKICVSVQKTNRIVRSGIAYIGFSRNRRRMYVFITFQFQMNKKEITKLEVDFKKFFCWRSNLSRMLTYNFLEARSANGCGKCHFWSEIGPKFEEPSGTPKTRIPGLSQIVKIFWQSPLEKLAPSAVFELVLCGLTPSEFEKSFAVPDFSLSCQGKVNIKLKCSWQDHN